MVGNPNYASLLALGVFQHRDQQTGNSLLEDWKEGGDLHDLVNALNTHSIPTIGAGLIVLPITAEVYAKQTVFTPEMAQTYFAYLHDVQDSGYMKDSIQQIFDLTPGEDDDNALDDYYQMAINPHTSDPEQALQQLTDYLNGGAIVWESGDS